MHYCIAHQKDCTSWNSLETVLMPLISYALACTDYFYIIF